MMKKITGNKVSAEDELDEIANKVDPAVSSDHNNFSETDLVQEYSLETDNDFAVIKNIEKEYPLNESLSSLPKDHELLKEILGEDYATQTISSSDFNQEQGAGELGAVSNETDIDDVIKTILHEDDELLDTESTDIDEFLQKYMMDDDSPNFSQDDEEENIDEVIKAILNEDNTLLNEDRAEADIVIEVTEPDASHNIAVEKMSQSSPSQKSKNHVLKSRPAERQNFINKTATNESYRSSAVNYRVPGIALFILVVVAGLVWYFVAEPEQEPASYHEVKSSNIPKIKRESAPYKEISTVLDEQVFDSTSSYSEPSTEYVKAEPVIKSHASINSTMTRLIEQQSSLESTKLTDDRFSGKEKSKVHETALETITPATVEEESHTEVIDDTSSLVDSLSQPEEVGSENAPPVEEPLTEVSDDISSPVENTTQLEKISNEPALQAEVKQTPATEKNRDVFWVLNLSSVHNQIKPATKALERIREAGIPAEIKPVFVNRKKWYRIRVIGFSSYAEARSFMVEVTDKTDINDYWISIETIDSE